MKRLILATLFLFVVFFTNGQSNSYQMFKDKFAGEENVVSLSVGGFLCRMAMNLAGEWEFRDAIKDVSHVRFITVPRKEFAAHGVSVNGFKKIIKDDKFDELARIKEERETVTFYLQETGNKKNRYLVLIEEDDEVVLIELKGFIDPSKLTESRRASKDRV